MYLSYRSGTSGWGITESQLSGTITPLYYQSVISETPDLGTFACATGASPAPIIEQTIVESNDDGSDKTYAYTLTYETKPVASGNYYVFSDVGQVTVNPSNGDYILQTDAGKKVFKHDTENQYLIYNQYTGNYSIMEITQYQNEAVWPDVRCTVDFYAGSDPDNLAGTWKEGTLVITNF